MVGVDNGAALQRLEAWCVTITRPIAFLGVIGMLVVAGITMVDVLLRWLVNRAIPGLNEVVAMMFAVAITACIPSGLAGGVNLKIDLFARWITGRLAAWLHAVGAALLMLFFALLTWQIARYAGILANQGRTTIILRWPQAPFIYGAALLLGVGTIVQAVMTANAVRRALLPAVAQTAHQLQTATASPLVARVLAMCAGVTVLALVAFAIADFAALSRWAQDNVGLAVTCAFILMWILMAGLVPLAAIMGLLGIAGAALFVGFAPALSAFATEATGFLTNSQVATLPLFLLMGSFAAVAGLSDDMYRLAHVVLSRFRGGLALATIGGCAGFGALTGSSLATAATIGRVAIPEMRKRGYSVALATGVCAAGGTLGPLVPPGSGPLVVFALLTEASIGRLFVGSVGPALLAVALYFLTIMLYVRISPGSAPKTTELHRGELLASLRQCLPVGVLFFGIMGGLYFGLFTDTESAAVGAFGAFLFALFRGKLGRGAFWSVMAETTATTAMIYGLIFGAQIFSLFVSVSALTEAATAFVANLHWTPAAVMALLLVFYLLLGALMEAFAVMVITVPIVTPLVLGMGWDIVWWGVIMMCVVETGMIHPPFGLNVFVLKSMLPNVSLWTIYRGVAPFVVADLVKLALMVLFPAITLWLVSTMLN